MAASKCWNEFSGPDDTKFSEVGRFLLEDETFHDCHFLVGVTKERIGGVRCALMNQSRVWWNMLSPLSPLAEKGDIAIPDIDPFVFKIMLRHCYGGLWSLSSLPLETALKLCYCADKYLMVALMDKITTRLYPTSVQDVFPALHCLLHHNLLGVRSAVEKIIQEDTTQVIAHHKFLSCDVEAVEFICKQDKLSCTEVALWDAILKWARQRAGSTESPTVREWILRPLKYIRLLTLSEAELVKHVFTEGILDASEISGICSGKVDRIESLCGTNACRQGQLPSTGGVLKVTHDTADSHCLMSSTSSSCIVVKNANIVLKSLTIKGLSTTTFRHSYGYPVKTCNVTLTNHIVNSSNEERINICLDVDILNFYDDITIPTTGVILKANTKYTIGLSANERMPCHVKLPCCEGHDFPHFKFYCSPTYDTDKQSLCPCNIIKLSYSVATSFDCWPEG